VNRWLSADQNKNPGKERENAEKHDWDRNRQRGRDAVKDKENGEQEHADVFCEVHGSVLAGVKSFGTRKTRGLFRIDS
jgi:hypothetical protein